VRAKILQVHPYKVPEIMEVEATSVHEPYLKWAIESTQPAIDRVAAEKRS
jgi:uncharacterized protein involved in tolerance to divalent cations